MSRLDQLISQYCPAGVPMVRLGEVCEILDSKRKPISKSKRNKGQYPYYGANGIQDYVDNYLFDGDFLLIGEDGSVITPSGKPILNWATNKFWVNNHAHIIEGLDGTSNLRYIYHALHLADITDLVHGVPPKLNQENLRSISIPLPPLPVQEEIVRILDAMSDLVTNLDAEISARQKQYEHAREKLICQQNYEHVTFESLGEIVRGKRFVRNDITESGTPCIHYGDMYTYYGVSASEARTYLQGEIVSKMRYAKKNDVIIVGAGENNEDIGVALAWLGDQPAAVHDACYIISHEQNPVYISQYTRTGIYHEQLKKIVVDGKICSFPLKGLAIISIPLPPLSVQQSIVERLDKMESLIQNLQTERDLRQKQYEYYREKLLLFAK